MSVIGVPQTAQPFCAAQLLRILRNPVVLLHVDSHRSPIRPVSRIGPIREEATQKDRDYGLDILVVREALGLQRREEQLAAELGWGSVMPTKARALARTSCGRSLPSST